MPFTNAPKYNQDREVWPDFVGETVIVEPVKKVAAVPTKYGPQDCYEAILWVLKDGALEPHAGIRIFNQRIVSQLEIAHRMQAPIPGHVDREGTSIRLMEVDDVTRSHLEALWDGSPAS